MAWTVNAPRAVPISPNSVASVASVSTLSALAKLGVALGQEIEVVDPTFGAGRAVFVKHSVTCTQYQMVHYDQVNATTALTPNTANTGRHFGIALAAASRGGLYGWVLVSGVCPVKKTAVAVAPNVTLYQSATTGRAMPTAASGKQLLGLRSVNAASVTSTVSIVNVQIAYAHIQGRVI